MGDKAGNATPLITIGGCGWDDDVGVHDVPETFIVGLETRKRT